VSTGLTHSVAVKQNGKLFSWGVGLCGQLGFAIEDINKFRNRYISAITTKDADEGPAALRREEKVVQQTGPSQYDFDEQAQIHHDLIVDKNVWLPCVALPYMLPISAKVQFKQVACGSHHTIAVSRAGEVYACGLSSSGQLGLTQQQIGAEGILNVYEMTKV
tara:strand:+ start:363 stop:848 length:486 start_codon:yes stop_codon:yes gene_type:complete